jgi:N-acetylmuramoyl-L-alanine amidase
MISNPHPFIICRSTALAVSMLCAVTHAQPAKGWKPVKIDETEYIPAHQIKEYYRFDSLQHKGDVVTLDSKRVAIEMEVGSTACSINGLKFVLYEKVKDLGKEAHISRRDLSYILDPVLRPNFIKNAGDFNTVILDPAHGGKSPGLINEFGTEAAYTLKIAQLASRQLKDFGFQVIMTRDDDSDLLLQERVKIANDFKEGAVFISISLNSGPKGESGIETFPLCEGEQNAGEFRNASMALATSTHGTLIRKLGKNTNDRGIKQVRHSVLASVKHPAILIEGGFMTHEKDARLIENETYQSALATAILDGVQKYRQAVKQNPPKVEEPAVNEAEVAEPEKGE